MNVDIREVANTVIENLDKDLPVSKYVEVHNALAEATGGDHDVVQRFKSKQDGYQRTVHLAKEIAVEAAIAGLKGAGKAAAGKKAGAAPVKRPASTGKRWPTVIAQLDNKKTGVKLINTLSTKTFKGVKKVTLNNEPNPKSYFNREWFEGKNIEVEVKTD